MSEMTWPTRGRHGNGSKVERSGTAYTSGYPPSQLVSRSESITVPSVFQPRDASQKANPVPSGAIQELRGRDPLALGVAERVAPCDLDLGQRAVVEPVAQFLLGGRGDLQVGANRRSAS